jgi:uncharacterized protein CbrC (UPF0167 family)
MKAEAQITLSVSDKIIRTKADGGEITTGYRLQTFDLREPERLHKILSSHIHSTNVWQDGRITIHQGRKRINLNIGTTGIMLDFDGDKASTPIVLDEIAERFADYKYVLYTSTGHKPKCHKLHVLLPFDPQHLPAFPNEADALYSWCKQQMGEGGLFHDADNCFDKGRKFYPHCSKEAAVDMELRINVEGTYFPFPDVRGFAAPNEEVEVDPEQYLKERTHYIKDLWNRTDVEERTQMAYQLALDCKRSGLPYDEAKDRLLDWINAQDKTKRKSYGKNGSTAEERLEEQVLKNAYYNAPPYTPPPAEESLPPWPKSDEAAETEQSDAVTEEEEEIDPDLMADIVQDLVEQERQRQQSPHMESTTYEVETILNKLVEDVVRAKTDAINVVRKMCDQYKGLTVPQAIDISKRAYEEYKRRKDWEKSGANSIASREGTEPREQILRWFGWLPSLSILGAYAGWGKSTLARQMVQEYLEENPEAVGCWLAFDTETPADVVFGLAQMTKDLTDRFQIFNPYDEKHAEHKMTYEYVRDWLRTRNPDVIIVDTHDAYMEGIEEGAYERAHRHDSMAKSVVEWRLRKFKHDFKRTATIFLHHTGKGTVKLIGSSGLDAVADVVMIMRPPYRTSTNEKNISKLIDEKKTAGVFDDLSTKRKLIAPKLRGPFKTIPKKQNIIFDEELQRYRDEEISDKSLAIHEWLKEYFDTHTGDEDRMPNTVYTAAKEAGIDCTDRTLRNHAKKLGITFGSGGGQGMPWQPPKMWPGFGSVNEALNKNTSKTEEGEV